MGYGYKTLILIDNSATVSGGNRDIVKATLKYLIRNAPVEDDFALATFTEQTELLVDYGSERQAYLDAVDKITYVEKSTCLSDVVMTTLTQWREADFAMRNILVFTDGLGAESQVYPIEEVYFKLNESGYPLYVIGLSQQTNEMMLKRAASMARISHGAFFPTDFEDSEANVDQKLTDKVLQEMEKKRSLASGEDSYEEKTKDAALTGEGGADEITTEEYDAQEYYGANEETLSAQSLTEGSRDTVFYFALVAGLLAVLMLFFMLVKYFGKKHISREGHGDEDRMRPEEVMLEDLNEPTRFFHLPTLSRIVIGSDRKQADIFLESSDVDASHCEITRRAGHLFIRDLQSERGTYLNGERLRYETQLHPADVIMAGRIKLMVRFKR